MSSYILEIFALQNILYPRSISSVFRIWRRKEVIQKILAMDLKPFERFKLGLQFDKIAPNEYNSTKIDKKFAIHTHPTQACDPLNIKLPSC